MYSCKWALPWVAACALLAATMAPVSAITVHHTSTGVRCTVVGTPGDDVLDGTIGRDVICGRGGDDSIRGHAGDDLVDAGTGDDLVAGGSGDDVIYGGAGRDSLRGGSGNDRLDGGAGKDALLGQAGSDRLQGGPDQDRLKGLAGDDRVRGGIGDDDLSGGQGGDNVDGGPGFNVCDVPSDVGDAQIRCATDETRPEIGQVTVSPTTVDVSDEAQVVQVEAHVTDDTGVKSVQVGNMASLVSGTPRDGVWAATIRVPRFVTPGPRDLDIFVRDRVGRQASDTRPSAYTVVNTVVDQEMPVLESLTLSTTSVDVRSDSSTIDVVAEITDDLAGASHVHLCAAHAFPTGMPSFRQAGPCASMRQASGTRKSSTWTGTYEVPKGAPSGTWNFSLWIYDAADSAATGYWYGPDELAANSSVWSGSRAIPDDGGVFTVLGAIPDVDPPELTSVSLTPSVLDTSHGALMVTADIAGTDVEGITGAHLFISGYAGYPDNQTWTDWVDIARVEDFRLQSGTRKDGVWRASFVVPGGTPDGTYFMQVVLRDSSHFESWVSPDSGWTYDNHVLTDELAPTGTHLVVANS